MNIDFGGKNAMERAVIMRTRECYRDAADGSLGW